jgi:hypothetical protein
VCLKNHIPFFTIIINHFQTTDVDYKTSTDWHIAQICGNCCFTLDKYVGEVIELVAGSRASSGSGG